MDDIRLFGAGLDAAVQVDVQCRDADADAKSEQDQDRRAQQTRCVLRLWALVGESLQQTVHGTSGSRRRKKLGRPDWHKYRDAKHRKRPDGRPLPYHEGHGTRTRRNAAANRPPSRTSPPAWRGSSHRRMGRAKIGPPMAANHSAMRSSSSAAPPRPRVRPSKTPSPHRPARSRSCSSASAATVRTPRPRLPPVSPWPPPPDRSNWQAFTKPAP